MTPPLPRYKIVYHSQVVNHLRAIDKKYHSGIRREIEEQLSFEPNKKTRNRKPLSKLVLNSEWESSLYWGGGVFKMTMRIASLADVKARFSEFVNFLRFTERAGGGHKTWETRGCYDVCQRR